MILNSITRVQVEDYDRYYDTTPGNTGGVYRNDDVDIELSQDFDDGFSVGFIDQEEWLSYDIDVPEDGFYRVVGRVASDLDRNHNLDIFINEQTTELNFGNTGGWFSWEDTSSSSLYLTAGSHQFDVSMNSSGFNINYFDLVPVNNIKIEAENYVDYFDDTPDNIGGAYRNDSVDIEPSQDFDNGFYVGWISPGEWLTYDVFVPEDGSYQVIARVASDLDDRQHSFNVSLDGQTTQLSFGDTGGWYSWLDVAGGSLDFTAGLNTLRVDMNGSGFNINYFDLIADI